MQPPSSLLVDVLQPAAASCAGRCGGAAPSGCLCDASCVLSSPDACCEDASACCALDGLDLPGGCMVEDDSDPVLSSYTATSDNKHSSALATGGDTLSLSLIFLSPVYKPTVRNPNPNP